MDPMCLSAEHHDNPRNPVLHYLGCLEFCERETYFKNLLENEKGQIEASLRRTEYLRLKVLEHNDVKVLVTHLQESFKNWRGSSEYKKGIAEVETWSGGKQTQQRDANINTTPSSPNSPNSPTSPTAAVSGHQHESYNPDHDTNAYLIQYRNSMPVNDLQHLGLSSRYEFPNHKIPVSRLLDQDMDVNPLWKINSLSEGDDSKKPDKMINYFHLPSNNMDVR